MTDASTVRLAKQLIDDGRTREAVNLLERRLAEVKNDHTALNMLAFAHFQSGDYRAAEAVYRTMVAVASPDPRDLYSLGQALQRQRKVEEARVWLTAAAAADPRLGPPQAPPAQPVAVPRASPGVPFTELGIPELEDLDEFTERLRARAKKDWWTENWYRIPWPLRIVQYGLLFAIVAWVLYAWVTFPS
jgi:tetratricopeptide (TPR) repeat protein